jgi:hypothetical protein
MLFLLILVLVGTFATIGTGIAGYRKANWLCGFTTSIIAMVIPFVMTESHFRVFRSMALNVFQPGVAYIAVDMWVIGMFFIGLVGLIICLFTGIGSLIRGARADNANRENRPSHIKRPYRGGGMPKM